MLVFPNAKINLGLKVTGIRPDGFHNIETVLFPISFCDVLEINLSENLPFEFNVSGMIISGKDQDNLCVRAYNHLKKIYDLPNVRMHLHKVIPMGAGLGGGSSDAAFTIKLLNDLFTLALSDLQMQQYASQLGSDCSFFIDDLPCFAFGKGDKFESVNLNLKGYSLVIVIPPVRVSTMDAYKVVEVKKQDQDIRMILETSPLTWKNILSNDFEAPIFQLHPEIRHIKEDLYKAGAVYASMSGSGSAVYGLFDRKIPELNSFPGCKIWTGRIN
ncbi:MAG: 4-(cytidine 5'-diphospho)-2-C-methyl-D-erythritol kinase [Bacteroidales bacterium]|jgi:4-diphosphocytidyl-2-C-methyl-D-erythritol kinase